MTEILLCLAEINDQQEQRRNEMDVVINQRRADEFLEQIAIRYNINELMDIIPS